MYTEFDYFTLYPFITSQQWYKMIQDAQILDYPQKKIIETKKGLKEYIYIFF